MTRPTVYTYFASKDDVFRAVADRVRHEFLELQNASTPAPRNAPRAKRSPPTSRRGPAITACLTVIAHQALTDPAVRTLRDELLARAERRNTRFVERLMAAGLARPALPPADLSRAVTGIVARAAEIVAEDPQQSATLARRIGDAYLRLAGIAPT